MRILLGVPGGIAAYKVLEFARLAVKAGHSVRVIQTPASLRFVGRASFAAITGAPVIASEFESDPLRGAWPGEVIGEHTPISHLALAERAEAFVIAPATANTLARLSSGAAEDLVTTSALACTCPILVAPAMNNLMWLNESTRSNVQALRDRGIEVIEPGEGQLASKGESGKGRLVEPNEILEAVERRQAGSEDLRGIKVIVTAGGTREPIDEVRFIGNRSSGRMGFAVAQAALERGATVTLIAANAAAIPPPGLELVLVNTAAQMQTEVEARLPSADVLVMAAAVADFRPKKPASGKLDKSAGIPTIELEPVTDILKSVSLTRDADQTIVGFAAEHGSAVERAAGKMAAKSLDLMVCNDISDPEIGFDSAVNAVTLITPDSRTEIPTASKLEVARKIVDAISRQRR